MDQAENLAVDMYIPGHGFIDSPTVLEEEWHEYKRHLQVVLDAVKRLHAAGRSVDQAIREADFGVYAEWSGANFQGPIGIRQIYAELNGELPWNCGNTVQPETIWPRPGGCNSATIPRSGFLEDPVINSNNRQV